MRRRVEFIYHPDGFSVPQLYLHGSWDTQGRHKLDWCEEGTPLTPHPDGSHRASLVLQAKPKETFSWGVKDEHGTWMLFEHEAQVFYPARSKTQVFRLGHRNWLGFHREGLDGYRVRVWAPHAVSVGLIIHSRQGQENLPMKNEGEYWFGEGQSGWSRWEGSPYGFEVTTSDGQTVVRADPYSRSRQGPQQGVGDLFLSPQGDYCHRYSLPTDGVHLLRFEVVPSGSTLPRHPPVLSLWKNDKRLTPCEIRSLCGQRPLLPKQLPWWEEHLRPNGEIALVKHHRAKAYSICIGPEKALRGLEYRLEGRNGEAYHDPWSTRLDGHHNWPRLGLVVEPSRTEDSLRPQEPAQDLRMYEVHIGSLLGAGDNLLTSNLQDLDGTLADIKRLGFNTLALMPTNATEGRREWGYLGTSTLAHQEAYAAPGERVETSLLRFINKAHKLELRVLNDVVYNHIGGFHNDLWEFDGLENSWFERNIDAKAVTGSLPERPFDTVECLSRTEIPSVRKTPWGPIPAYNKPAVAQFYIDHAMDQIERLGFDGLRFDFTNLIHSPGSGDHEGWRMLQAIHLRLRYFFPNAVTFAEEFPPHPVVTTPVDQGGAGFSGMWNTEHQHRLIFDHHRPSVTQNLVEDCRPNLSYLLEHILFPKGFATGATSATVLSNHDEVGNAQQIYNLVRNHPRGLDIARLVSWFSLLCPGHPILFQGTEDLASNFFSWGLPHTWDVHSHLGGSKLPKFRLQHLTSIKDILQLRAAHNELWASGLVYQHYLHEARHLLMMKRGRFWIAANFGQTPQEVPLKLSGRPELVANSEKKSYGYQGKPTRGRRIGGYALKVWMSPEF